jgi:hypothetical protein
VQLKQSKGQAMHLSTEGFVLAAKVKSKTALSSHSRHLEVEEQILHRDVQILELQTPSTNIEYMLHSKQVVGEVQLRHPKAQKAALVWLF